MILFDHAQTLELYTAFIIYLFNGYMLCIIIGVNLFAK